MGFWSTLGKIGGGLGSIVAAPFTAGTSLAWLPAALAAGGTIAGGLASGRASNRGTAAALSVDQQRLALEGDQTRINQQAENRTERGDAWKKLLNADYTLNSKGHTPATLTSQFTGTRALPSFGIARTGGPSEAVTQGATGLQSEVLKRLTSGSQLPGVTATPDLSQYAKPGIWERILGIAAPVATGLGSIYGAIGKQASSPTATPAVSSPYNLRSA